MNTNLTVNLYAYLLMLNFSDKLEIVAMGPWVSNS